MKTALKAHPPQHISASELRQNLSKVLQDVEEGESFVVERHGEPVALLQPAPNIQGVPYTSLRTFKLSDDEFEDFMEGVRAMRQRA